MATLNALLAGNGVTLGTVEQHLSSVPPRARVEESTSLDRRHLATLWKLAEGTAPIRAEDLVPRSVADLEPVPFYGQNSLPVARMFRKVFYRQSDGTIGGYNESPASPLVGPGYYTVAFDAKGTFVDYTKLPKEAPIGWPKIARNDRGLAILAYGYMHDYLRRVHGRVFIGRALKFGKETENYFVLARPD